MAKTVEELQQENNDLLRQLVNKGGSSSAAGDSGATGKLGAFGSAVDKSAVLMGKMASGTASTTDLLSTATGVIGKFGGAGEFTAARLKQIGEGAIEVNDTLKSTGKYGITFGQNLGEANLAIKGAQLTMPEFNNLIQQSGKSLAGLSGGQNESAKTFLKLSTEMQGTTLAQDLKAAGMSSLELNEAMITVARTSGPVNLNDVNSRKQLITSALTLADEMNKVADISGKSRKQQESEIAAIQARADVQAASLAAMRVDPEFGTRMTEATASMTKFGPKIEELLAEEATLGGARSEDALNTKAAMGSAGAAIAEYGKAIKGGNAVEIAATKERAERAIAARLADESFNKSAAVTQGNVLNMGAVVTGSFETTKNIMAKQAEMSRKGIEIDEYTAMKMLEKEGKLRTQGLTPEGAANQGAAVGRTINQIDNLGKVVGGVMAQGFNKLNTELGQTIGTYLPALNAKLKAIGSPEGLKTTIASGANSAVNTMASKLGANVIRKDAEPSAQEGTTTRAASATNPLEGTGVASEVKDLLSQLNNKLGNIDTNTKNTADFVTQQIRATKDLSGNRLQ